MDIITSPPTGELKSEGFYFGNPHKYWYLLNSGIHNIFFRYWDPNPLLCNHNEIDTEGLNSSMICPKSHNNYR